MLISLKSIQFYFNSIAFNECGGTCVLVAFFVCIDCIGRLVYGSNITNQIESWLRSLPTQSKIDLIRMSKCKHCEFQTTWYQDYCCKACEQHPDQHGKWCDGHPLDDTMGNTDTQQESIDDTNLIVRKCTNCNFDVTWHQEEYCCWSCKANAGQHGPWCDRIIFSGGDADPACDDDFNMVPSTEFNSISCDSTGRIQQ